MQHVLPKRWNVLNLHGVRTHRPTSDYHPPKRRENLHQTFDSLPYVIMKLLTLICQADITLDRVHYRR